MSCPATTGSAASAGTAVKDSPSWACNSSSGPRSRATPTTFAPALDSAVAMPLPKPRLAPVTSAAAPAISFPGITILRGYCGFPRRSFGGLLVEARFCEGRYEPAPPRASSEGVPSGWNLLGGDCGTRVPPGPALGDQAQVPCPGDGLGAVGRAQLAQEVADVLFDREDGDEQLTGDGLVRFAGGKHCQHLQLTAGQRVDQTGHFRRGAGHGGLAVERLRDPGKMAERDGPGR